MGCSSSQTAPVFVPSTGCSPSGTACSSRVTSPASKPAPALAALHRVTGPVRSLLQPSYGIAWQGFGSGGAIGVVSVRSCEKLPLCLIKPVPASSKMDPPLAKAKPISDSGSTSGITCLRREKKNPAEKQQ